MEDPILETDAWTLVGVLIWKLNVYLPYAALKWSCSMISVLSCLTSWKQHTLFWSLESDKELLPVVYLVYSVREESTKTDTIELLVLLHSVEEGHILLSFTSVTS